MGRLEANMTISELWTWKGTAGRGRYALVGLIGFALKHNMDRILATSVFEREWGPFNYWISPVEFPSLTAADARFLLAMVTMSLPFIWVGLSMTHKRLRSAGLPAWGVAFFFLPFLNLLFFLILCVLPERTPEPVSHSESWLDRLIPIHPIGSAAMGVMATNALGIPAVLLATEGLGNYGWGLFVGVPFCVGLVSVLVYTYHEPRSLLICLLEATIAVGIWAGLLIAGAVEGLICIIMAAPLALPLALLGGLVGYLIQRPGGAGREAAQVYPALVLALPLLLVAENASQPPAPVFEVRSSIEIQATPAAVWNQVVSFSQLPEPEQWLFRLGIAYPIHAEIEGSGPGAERHCVFSTGSFVEPIEVWDEPRLLKFSVTSNPPPMQEWTPYEAVHPPHLKGFLESDGGQFLLKPLPGGQTLLEGTTWYRHSLWPATYWKVWSDEIIHQIHLRVLRHIKALAEG